ncbi:HEAT repeat domain-containing protein [Streptomyces sp. NPDC101118]|uniref:HEAT repeat domain-containing protein n=1 Tax=Streptomyces sp. NPDC101118 TaxID=3366109 RepID=UPI00382F876C
MDRRPREPTELLEESWQEFESPGPGRRHLCLDAIGDVLETGRLGQDDVERTVGRLVAVALAEEDHTTQESALHAVSTAAAHHELPYRLVEPLAAGADHFPPLLLEYVVGVLGATHDPAALPAVERFLSHPREGVRREAADAVYELEWSSRRQGTG